MNDTKRIRWILATVVMGMLSAGAASAADAPTTAEQIGGLQQMCAETAQARSERQAEEALYFRLGGQDRIQELTTEIVRLHNVNKAIRHMFVDVDSEALAKHVADFVAAGTGGSQKYTGRAMPATHADLGLTDADFLAAGGDIVKAMETLGYDKDEIEEILCILLSLKDQVVFD